MAKVKTLKADVYKKIAAGEVVERPLSVVKELVENSIDAGADSIKVELLEGGKRLIRVIDNGSGFDPADIEPAFKNHSTSKLTELSDFNSLFTLGFRGEALPSILEVAKIEVETSDNNDGVGWRCIFEDGQLQEQEGIAGSKGSTITVKELFYNFPVRRKFLKADRTELNQILSFLEPVALVNYNIALELVHNGKTVFIYKKASNLGERIYQVFGKEFLDVLQEVDFELPGHKIYGFVSKLNTGVSVKKHQYFFVNGRPVREKTLVAAVNNTFQKYLEKHRNPVAILLLDIPPEEVDVNIHPMKLEIKFVNSSTIYRLIKDGIQKSFPGVTEFNASTDLPDRSGAGGYGGYEGNRGYGAQGNSSASYSGFNPGYSPRNSQSSAGPGNFGSPGGGFSSGGNPGGYVPGREAQQPQNDFEQAQLFAGNFLNEDEFILIGQYKNSYILVEKKEELLIIDQHNAQERVNFDKLKKEYGENKVTSINPLFPVIIELSPSEAAQMRGEKKEILEKMGFRIEPLSGNSFDVKSFPQVLGEKSVKDTILEVLHMSGEKVSVEDNVLAEIACKSAIKINHKLYPDQMKTIVRNLFNSTNPYFCPHKRPIIIDLSLEKIEKMLKRK